MQIVLFLNEPRFALGNFNRISQAGDEFGKYAALTFFKPSEFLATAAPSTTVIQPYRTEMDHVDRSDAAWALLSLGPTGCMMFQPMT